MIDLRSDTVTQPGVAMRQAMLEAPLGDDVYGEDPSVNALESLAATMLDKEAAVFAPSGTQSNLLALLTHCGRGDEYIVGQQAHTYRLEGGGAAVLGGIQPQPLEFSSDATLPLEAVEAAIKPDDFHFARTRLLCLENTHNGTPLPMAYMNEARRLCDAHQLNLHLDGARLFNAAHAIACTPADVAAPFDSVSICLSKGLGAPVGSVLVGSEITIRAARRWRKMLGGGMRQAGMLAAAGSHALTHNVDRLVEDHRSAERVATALREKFAPESIAQATNMVHLNLSSDVYAALKAHMRAAGIRLGRARWVFHLDLSESDVDRIVSAVNEYTPRA